MRPPRPSPRRRTRRRPRSSRRRRRLQGQPVDLQGRAAGEDLTARARCDQGLHRQGEVARAARYDALARGAVRFRTGSDPGGSSPKDPSPVPRTSYRDGRLVGSSSATSGRYAVPLVLLAAALLVVSGAGARSQARLDIRGNWSMPTVTSGGAVYPQVWVMATENRATGAWGGHIKGTAGSQVWGTVSGHSSRPTPRSGRTPRAARRPSSQPARSGGYVRHIQGLGGHDRHLHRLPTEQDALGLTQRTGRRFD